MNKKGYKKLEAWKKADELALAVYDATKKFPSSEIFGITLQLRRAVLSVPINIVEGSGRQGKKETRHFINVALGSLAETEYLLEFSFKINYLNKKAFVALENKRQDVGKLLWGLYKSF